MEGSGGVSGGRRDDLEDVGEGLASVCLWKAACRESRLGSGPRGRHSQAFGEWMKDMWAVAAARPGVGLKGRMRRFLSSALHYEWELPTSFPPLKESKVKNQVALEVSFGYPRGVSSNVTLCGA